MYAVLALVFQLDVEIWGETRKLPLAVNGVVGVLPVFETKECAEKYANGKYAIVNIQKLKED